MVFARSGLVILAVLMVVTLSALVGLSIVTSGTMMRAHADASSRRFEAEAMAWSGVQIALGAFEEQQAEMLSGSDVTLASRHELYTTATGERAIVEFVAKRSGDPFETNDELAIPLGACLNVNAATEAMLAELEGVSDSQAADLVRERRSGPFASVAEAEERCGWTVPGLQRLVCVESAEREIECGTSLEERAGTARIDLASGSVETMLDTLVEVASQATADSLEPVLQDASLGSRQDLVELLIEQSVPEEEWGAILDLVCFTSGGVAVGRVDLLRASEPVLAAVPGITSDSARAIVNTRERLSESERRSIAWPVTSGALTADSFREAVDWLTNRSMQHRVRIRAGFAPPASGDTLSAAELRDLAFTEELTSPVEWDVVIDASETPPRVSLIRDVTAQAAWQLVAAELSADEFGDEPEPATTMVRQRVAPSAPQVAPAPEDSARGPAPIRVGRWQTIGGDS